MSVFKFRIFDIHEVQSFNSEGELITEPVSMDWMRFDCCIDVTQIKITSFREYVLFDKENNPTNCTKVIFDDGSYLYAVHSLEAFEKKYSEEYLTLIKNLT